MKLIKVCFLLSMVIILSCESNKFTAANGEVHEISSLVGMDVFDIAYGYSDVNPETLKGTNNQRWVVYYQDIDVTLVANKSTNIVQTASKGKNPE